VVSLKEYDVQLAKKSEYEKRIQGLGERKRFLYERFLTQEISLDEYKAQKAEYDGEISDLSRVLSSMAADITHMGMDTAEMVKLQEVASEITDESQLTQELADRLIDRVHIFPGNQIEVDWKMKDFCKGAI